MIGSILSTVTKVATLPVDLAAIGIDVATGGDGSKSSRQDNPFNLAQSAGDLRDEILDALEELDD